LIPQTVAQSLGYVGAKDISTTDQLKEGISDKRMLIVLDNCEHLIEDISSFTSGLLLTCSHLKILATSRESLRVSGEWLYPVPAFGVPGEPSSIDMTTVSNFSALTLFAERARAVRPDFALNPENVHAVSAICAHLDGLPLAIELIAARMRLMSPEALLSHLNDQFILSADGMRAASPRQKTLNDAIRWSYDLLSPEEQKLFAYLSVFSGGFTLGAAEALFSQDVSEKSVTDLITLLLDKSLLQRAFNSDNELRFTMLVTIQEFAWERLREMGDETTIRNRHLTYFLDLAQQANKELRGPNQLEWLHHLEIERDNLRAALDSAIETRQTEIAIKMVRSLHWYWFARGDHTEGRQWLDRVLNMPDVSFYPEEQAEVLSQLAHHTWLQIGPKEARPFVEQALSLARAHHDKWNTAKALTILGLVLIYEDNFADAQSNLEAGKTLFQEVGDTWEYAHAIMGLALRAYKQEKLETSLALHEQALLLFRDIGDRYFQSSALRHIGNIQVKQSNSVTGIANLREALILAQQLDTKYEIARTFWVLAEAFQSMKKPSRAIRLYWATKNVLNSIGAWWLVDDIEFEKNLGACRAALGEEAFTEAVHHGRAMTMEQAIAFALGEK